MKNVFAFKKELIDEYVKFSTSFAKPSAEDICAKLESGGYRVRHGCHSRLPQ